MKITMDGKYTTRNGTPVRILCVDRPGDCPVVGYLNGTYANEICGWRLDGINIAHSDLSLIEAKPEPFVEWVICAPAGHPVDAFSSEGSARKALETDDITYAGCCLAKRTTEFVD